MRAARRALIGWLDTASEKKVGGAACCETRFLSRMAGVIGSDNDAKMGNRAAARAMDGTWGRRCGHTAYSRGGG